MKAIKYLLAGALISMSTAQAMAQDAKTAVAAITKVIVDNKGNAAAVKQPVKDFEKAYKKDADALAGLGRAYLDIKDMDNALKYADLAIKANGKKAAGYILRGDIAAINENGGDAAMWYQTATIQDPADPQGYIKYARVYQKVDAAGAEEMLRKLTNIDPSYPVDAEIAHMYYFNHKYNNAFENYQKVDMSKLDDDKLTEYAMSAYLLRKYKEGAAAAEYGTKQSPRKAGLNRLASYCYTEVGDFENALRFSNKLFNESDSAKFSARDYIYAGRALKGANLNAKAIDSFKKAYEMDNTLSEILKYISDAYMESEDYDNSIAYYKQYFETIKEKSSGDYTSYAKIYENMSEKLTGEAKTKALLEADKAYEELAKISPANKIFAAYKRANIHHAINPDVKKGEAKPYYEELANLVEAKADKSKTDLGIQAVAFNYLCVYYIQNDQVDKAKEYAAKLQAIQPDNETAKQILDL